MSLLVSNALNGYNACFVMYSPESKQIGLLNDAGSAWISGTIASFSTILQNSQCSVNPANSVASAGYDGVSLSVNIAITFKPAFAGGKNIYASSTDAAGATSGWQAKGIWIVNSTDQAPNNLSVYPTSGLGTSEQFTFSASDPDGIDDLSTTQILFNNVLSGTNACFFVYNPSARTVALYNDNATSTSTARLGASTILANSQCALNLTNAYSSSYSAISSVSGIAIAFTVPGFVASKEVWMNATDLESVSSGWSAVGTWSIPVGSIPPFSISLYPNSGAGNTQSFQTSFTDTNGASRISASSILVNSSLYGVGGCFATYFAGSNTFGLLNDAGTAYSVVSSGSNKTVQNSQCLLNGLGSSAYTYYPLTLNVTFDLTFLTGPFSGPKNVYLWSQDTNFLSSGWSAAGTWTVP